MCVCFRCSFVCCSVRFRIQGCSFQQPVSAQLRGAMGDRSRSRSPRATYVGDCTPMNDHRQLQPAARNHPRPQVLWLIEDGKGRWREVRESFAQHLEEQFLKNVEVAVGELKFPGATKGGFYTHMMINQNHDVMTQTKFEDPERKHIIHTKRLVQVIMQRSRADICIGVL